MWEATRGLELLTLKGHSGAVFSAAFSPDDQRIVTAGADKTIKSWNSASSEQVARCYEEEQLAAQSLQCVVANNWTAQPGLRSSS